MPPTWPPLAPLVEPLLGLPYETYTCWGLVAHLLKQGWNIDLQTDPEALATQMVEVWFRGDPPSPLGLVQPWDCLVLSTKNLVGDHCGLALDSTRFVHTRRQAGVVLDRLNRWEPKLLQVARLRPLVAP